MRQRDMSFTEASIPPFEVRVAYDGCTNWTIDLPDSLGSKEQCLEFISKHLPPKGGYEFDLINVNTGRCVSYCFTPAARRHRLHIQDLKEIT